MQTGSVTVGSIVSQLDNMYFVWVDGEYVGAMSASGVQLQPGQSVNVLRLGNGRYQVMGGSGFDAPQM